jgi:hypothetical protein
MAWECGARLHDLVQHKKRRGSIAAGEIRFTSLAQPVNEEQDS